jgi:hypothetical protein
MLYTQSGGDVGNRTRVRKNRLSNIYERSQSIDFARLISTDKDSVWLTAGARKLLFRIVSGVAYAAL